MGTATDVILQSGVAASSLGLAPGVTVRPAGGPGPLGVIVVQIDDGLVSDIRAVLNPDKLAHLEDLDAPIPVDPTDPAPLDRLGAEH